MNGEVEEVIKVWKVRRETCERTYQETRTEEWRNVEERQIGDANEKWFILEGGKWYQ